MNIGRYLRPEQVKLEIETRPDPDADEETAATERFRLRIKDGVIEELCDLLCASGKVGSRNKLLADLVNRERKSSTGIGHGVAIPHVRTMNAKEMIMAFARSTEGVEFLAVDGRPVHLLLAVVAPPYDDAQYLKIYKEMATLFQDEEHVREIMEAEDVHQIIKVFRGMP